MAKRRKKRSYRRKKTRRACPKRCRRKCSVKRGKRSKKFLGIGSDAWLVGIPIGLVAGYAAFKGAGV